MARAKSVGAPPVSKVLCEWLESKYPNCVPHIEMTDREVWLAVGVQKVIRFLRLEEGRQNDNIEPTRV